MSATPYSRMLSLGSRKGSTPIEDFLTEALAAAFNRDPRPLIMALQSQPKLARTLSRGSRYSAQTQVAIKGTGRLDLVLKPERGAQIWIEVKVLAGEHGDQLPSYERAAKNLRPHAQLVMLARPGVVPSIEIPKITWGAIVSSVSKCHRPSDLWLEMCNFLEEEDLGSNLSWPLTSIEAAALDLKKVSNPSASSAIAKIKNFSIQVLENLNMRDRNQWFANIDRKAFLDNQIKELGRLVYQFETDPRQKNYLSGTDPFIFVWVGFESHALKVGIEGRAPVDLRKELSDSYATLESYGWVCEQENILSVKSEKLAFAKEELAILWVLERFAELKKTGAYALIQTASRAHPVDYYEK